MDETSPVAPPPRPLSPRQQEIRALFDRLAPERPEWIVRSRSFYEGDWSYMRFVIPKGSSVLEVGCGAGDLLAALEPGRGVGVDLSPEMIRVAHSRFPTLSFHAANAEDETALAAIEGPFDYVVLSDTIGLFDDCEAAFAALHRLMRPESRLVVAYYSQLWEPLLRLASRFGLRMPQTEQNWLSTSDTANLMALADFEMIRQEWRQLLPRHLLGLGPLINRWIAPLPLIRRLALRTYLVARPTGPRPPTAAALDSLEAPPPGAIDPRATDPGAPPSVSVVVPCRNERGNIEAAVTRTPRMAPVQEIIFVEGGSRDGTYEECLRVQAAYSDHTIKVMKQEGKGKGDAVRKGFAAAEGDILMILDADLTVPPETLPKFYRAIASGKGEFANGTRLVYPMQSGAMRPLNWIANRAFAMIFSYLLNQRFTDTLCGTKVLSRNDYLRIAANRIYFGDFDPFGDFDLLFGAAKLNLKIVEVPIRYADRTYGETQISRFADGFLLARMVLFAWTKMKALR